LINKHGIECVVRIVRYSKNFRVKNKFGQNISVLIYPKTLKTNIFFKSKSIIHYVLSMKCAIDLIEGL
jgi:hypothetical protein